jgi:dolichyl-diphosphooligosaccharide--protein glycosyltransferase
MRREIAVVTAIAAAAFVIRVYPAWDAVFGGGGVNFLETDAWYHVRLVENQVRNYPWRVTLDPYAASGGQFVAIAPLYDTITATAVLLLYGRNADTERVERVAAFVPPAFGALTVAITWALGRRWFDWRAGLLSAALLAVLPGHFMDRTMLGFVDHHALEALLAMAALLAIVRAIRRPTVSFGDGAIVGVLLGCYLLTWSSGAFLLAILGVWLMLQIPLALDAYRVRQAARLIATAALVALLLVAAFQDSRMHRYANQIMALVGLIAIALAAIPLTTGDRRRRTRAMVAGIALIVVAGVCAWMLIPRLVMQIATDVGRLVPSPTRMGVLEARPLFMYSGEWNWLQPWQFFRTGFLLGLVAIARLALEIWRERDEADLLVWVYAAITLAATIGQNRFGYYLVTACALLGGWLVVRLVDWSRSLGNTLAREAALIAIITLAFVPNLAPSVLLMPRSASLAGYWQDAMTWLRRETPAPFVKSAGRGDDYYFARYSRDGVAAADYSIMNWWDQGYWIVQRARRVPVSNPTQERAALAAKFYVETDEMRALQMARDQGARFVLSDWELPFRLEPDGTMMGRFQSVLDWAGADHSQYYEIYYQPERDRWTPLWVFHPAYYQSMTYRLTVMGGTAVAPANTTTVLTVEDRTDANGNSFRAVIARSTYPTHDAALQAAAARPIGETVVVGLDPWRTAFPIAPLTAFVEQRQFRTAAQPAIEAPWVRVFETR